MVGHMEQNLIALEQGHPMGKMQKNGWEVGDKHFSRAQNDAHPMGQNHESPLILGKPISRKEKEKKYFHGVSGHEVEKSENPFQTLTCK